MSNFFGNWFCKSKKKVSQPQPGQKPRETPKPDPGADHQPGTPYKKGDFIGQKYQVYGVLGMGGFGIVCLVYSHETKECYALKTFRDEYLADQEVRKRFHQEASVWVELGRHPFLVRSYRQFLALAPAQYAQQIERARQRARVARKQAGRKQVFDHCACNPLAAKRRIYRDGRKLK
jgi:hypothetical protein